MRFLLALLCFLHGTLCLAADAATGSPNFRRLGIADGLPSTHINAVSLDRDGYVWIATRDGLARYDGVGYRVYRHVPGDLHSLPGNFVQSLYVDAGNRVWVGVEGHGLSVLDLERRKFRHFDRADFPMIHSDDVWAITGTGDGALWFGMYAGGLYRLTAPDAATPAIQRFDAKPDDPHRLPSPDVIALAVDSADTLWVGTAAGLVRRTPSGFDAVDSKQLSDPTIFSLSADDKGGLWIGTMAGLDFRGVDGKVSQPSWRNQLPHPVVSSVLTDAEGTRWVATRRGLARVMDGKIEPLDASVATLPFFQVMADNEHGLWFASVHDGLFRLPADWRNFRVYSHEAAPNGVRSLPVVSLAPARGGRAWLVGANQMLDRLNPNSGRIEAMTPTSAWPDSVLLSVAERRDGSVWVGHAKGLSRFNPATGVLRHWQIEAGQQPLLKGPVRRLFESDDGLLWVSSYGNGIQARDADGTVIFSLKPGDGQGLAAPEVQQFGTGPDGALWLAGTSGLQRWDAVLKKMQFVPGSPREPVFGFVAVPPDTVWLHRMAALEAYRWDGTGLRRFRQIGAAQGLPAVSSGGLAADRSGAVWVTTPRGLLRYDAVGERLRLFSVRDGLPGQEFEAQAPLLTPGGLGLASSNNGLVQFDPTRLRANPAASRLVVDAVDVRRDGVSVSFPAKASRIELQPGDRDLHISARLLVFADPASHRYRFFLHGVDTGWIASDARGERLFPRLDPGEYQLEIAAADADGRWSKPRVLAIVVSPPWWQSGPALAAWTVLAVLAIGVSFRAYRSWLRERQAALLREQRQRIAEQGSEAKTRFLATLGHEIRTPMTGVLGMSELLLSESLAPSQRRRVESIQRAGLHLLRLVNDALDLARIESNRLTLHCEPFDLHALLDEVAAMLRAQAEAKGLLFSLQRGPGTPRVLRGDVDRVRQILFNLGSNAIKFTEEGEVAVRSLPIAPIGVSLEVSDTGPGMNSEQLARLFQRFEQADGERTARRYGGSGLGLAISQELAGAMGGRIDVQSLPGLGATFRVSLPLASAPIDDVVVRGPAVAAVAASSRQVLVIEDDDTVAEVIVGLLRALGHSVAHAPQALAALTLSREKKYDLAFVDLDLPGLDGFELARLLQAQSPQLPLIALTARADTQAEPMARVAGMCGFLRKPVTGEMLSGVIETVVPLPKR